MGRIGGTDEKEEEERDQVGEGEIRGAVFIPPSPPSPPPTQQLPRSK